ncbi:MAG: hypothetical protein IPH57_03640 [Saprospiraceae bacterium]|nr:hypothetical protein [Saprospiraceae bacterium]
MDPLAEKYGAWSPYNYVYNNPLKYVDPTGMEGEWYPEYDEKNRKINLVKETGDTKKSLEKWANGAFSVKQVSDLYNSMSEDGKIDMSNTFIGKFAEGFLADQDEFNCFSEVANGIKGNTRDKYGEGRGSDIKNLSKIGYKESALNEESLKTAQPFKSAFGYTMKDSDGDYYGDGKLEHVEINAGKDS